MAATTINKSLVSNPPAIPDGTVKVRVFDNRIKGFILEFRKSCATYYFRYEDARGRAREIKLGRTVDVALDQARKQAEKLKSEVSLGADPIAVLERQRAIPSVATFLNEQYLPHAKERMRSYVNVVAYCRRMVAALGTKAVDEVTAADVANFRRRLIDEKLSNASVNRHLCTLRAAFNLARRWQVYDGPNPAASPGMLTERHRDEYLSAVETQALFRALEEEKWFEAAQALRLLVLTGARKNEILRAKWVDVDFDRCLLTVPRSKNGKRRYIPLTGLAMMVVHAQWHRRSRDNPFVLPGAVPGRPIINLRPAWEKAKKKAGLQPTLRIHDLRHSFASALANSGVPLNEIGVILGHSQLATTAR